MLVCPSLICPPCEYTKLYIDNYCNDCFPSKVSHKVLKQGVLNLIWERNELREKIKGKQLKKTLTEIKEIPLKIAKTDNVELQFIWNMFSIYGLFGTGEFTF